MTELGTFRRYRPDPSSIGRPEAWGRGRADASVTADSIVVTAAGEFDASNAAKLAGYVERHGAVASRLYLDLRDVTFFAAAGLTVLRRVEHQLEQSGVAWALVAGPAVRKLLRICDVHDLPQLETVPTQRRDPTPTAPVCI